MSKSVSITRHFNAPRERVFEAFTNAQAMQEWYGPETFTCPHVESDPRPGGHYRIEMRSPDGTPHIVTGEYQEVRAPEKLVFTWAWLAGKTPGHESLVTITFVAKNGGTEMTLLHSGLASVDDATAHEGGWSSSLNDLGKMFGTKS
jgi:uncharacterized protein YndB with AHSA1/START domain